MRRLDCHHRLKQVKSSHEAALRTVTVFIGIAEQQPGLLYDNDLDLIELRTFAKELHDLYFVRMFACFESFIRHFWWNRVRETKPNVEVLLNAMAQRFGVPQDVLDAVHGIRDFRNNLIHEDHVAKRRFTMDEASGPLNTYLARLPLEW